jgi:cytosine/adenosine deaminase-related metal-dependent hydrolase
MDQHDAGMPEGMWRDGHDALREQIELDRKWKQQTSELVRGCVAPRFVISCSDDLLLASGEAAREHGMTWHSHVSENYEEVEAVRSRTGEDNARFFDHLGLLGPNSVMAHGVKLTEEERRLLAERGCTIAHCPSTNLKMSSGMADTLRLQAEGVHLTLGSDGAACNNRLDSFQEMRQAALLGSLIHGSNAVHPGDILRWATLEGARALGLEGRLGELTAGQYADMVALDPELFVLPGRPEEVAPAVYNHLVYTATSAQVRHVWVNGRQRVRDGQLVDTDRGEIFAEYLQQRTRVVERAGI